MFAVQLLRVSVHERIGAAAEDFLLQVEKGEEAARVPALRALLTERLTAAAEEIVDGRRVSNMDVSQSSTANDRSVPAVETSRYFELRV
ncbi:hypothetical protein F2P81_022897 [Scophthalmus maximus]|uniref:Uncharacterized protein n=1 Tax=Scophthalmus maximus TaxID=52904 RepID=A0A6A4RV47_SCOMX|nr:hypothetical protein F2P81_022897 [Scophthalmus maximus]